MPHRRTIPSRTRTRRLTPETVLLLKQILLGAAVALGIGLIITGIWYGTRLEALTIQTVSVSGGETLSHQQLETHINEQLSGTYFGLIPRRFAWLYPEADIRTSLLAVDRVETAEVVVESGTELIVTVTEYLPRALWCYEENPDTCFFINDAGYAFASAPSLTGGALMRYVTLGRTPERGDTVQELSDLTALEWFSETLEQEQGWAVQRVEVDAVGDAFFILAGGSEIKVSLRDNPATPLSNLETILGASEYTELEPGAFQYIDLRFGNKVFVNRTPDAALEGVSISEFAIPTEDVLETALSTILAETEESPTISGAAEPVTEASESTVLMIEPDSGVVDGGSAVVVETPVTDSVTATGTATVVE